VPVGNVTNIHELSLNIAQALLNVIPAQVNIATIQPIVIYGNSVFLEGKDKSHRKGRG
jgi:hypothetical protein